MTMEESVEKIIGVRAAVIWFVWVITMCANSTTKKTNLEFWERTPESTTPAISLYQLLQNQSVQNQSSADRRTLKLLQAKNQLARFFLNLRRNVHGVDTDYLEYFDRTQEQEWKERRSQRTKDRQPKYYMKRSRQRIIDRLRRAGFWTSLDDIRFGNDDHKTRKAAKQWKDAKKRFTLRKLNYSLPRGNRVRLAQDEKKPEQEKKKQEEKEKKKKENADGEEEKNPVFPYNILAQVQEQIIPTFENVNITFEVLGRTVEYNDIVMMKATLNAGETSLRTEKSKYSDDEPEKKIIFIVHGLSVLGFESLPCLSRLQDFLKLVSYYYAHLDKFDIFLIPMGNPDGVAMARAKSFWNKNVSPQRACPGVAVDRNFDVAWNESHDESSCSQHFPGIMPFSEIESVAVRETFHKYSNKIYAYLHVHAGTHSIESFKGDAVLYPKGFTEMQSDDDKYIDLRGEIEETMKNASFKVLSVTVDTLYSWYGKITGSSVDYAATIYGIPYAMELVMQLYADDQMVSDVSDRETSSALTEIWQRVLDVIFNNMYKAHKKSLEGN